MQTVAIAGVGLIGGSFAQALRAAGFDGHILGVSSPATIEQACKLGVIDRGASLEEAVQTADLLYLAQPISQILSTIDQIGEMDTRRDLLITDAGSTKQAIVARAQQKIRGAQFVGGHPMAGKESRGVGSAEPELFRGRTYVLTPRSPGDLSTGPARIFVDWIARIGAVLVTMSPGEHDVTVSFTSHLPQLLSTTLACTLSDALAASQDVSVSGPGLSDTTRLALSEWDIWRDILTTNAKNIEKALGMYIDKLSEIRQNLTDPSIQDKFRMGADTARRFRR
jgi:prephenate dehydrogenase